MLKIRLQRVGRKNDPSFRLLVTESTRSPKSGDYIELLGSYDPKRSTEKLNAERITYWLSQGAQTSGTVHNLLVQHSVIKGKKVNVLPKKTPIVKEQAPKEQPAAAPAAAAPKEAAPKPEEEAPKEAVPEEKAPEEKAPEAEETPTEEKTAA